MAEGREMYSEIYEGSERIEEEHKPQKSMTMQGLSFAALSARPSLFIWRICTLPRVISDTCTSPKVDLCTISWLGAHHEGEKYSSVARRPKWLQCR